VLLAPRILRNRHYGAGLIEIVTAPMPNATGRMQCVPASRVIELEAPFVTFFTGAKHAGEDARLANPSGPAGGSFEAARSVAQYNSDVARVQKNRRRAISEVISGALRRSKGPTARR
jgi:hypothetical protein